MKTLRLFLIPSMSAAEHAGSTDATAERQLSMMVSKDFSNSLTGGAGLGLPPLLEVLGDLLAEDPLVDDPHVDRVVLEER